MPPMTTYDAPSLLSAARKSAKSLLIGETSRHPELEGGVEQRHGGCHPLFRSCVQSVLDLVRGELVLGETEAIPSLSCRRSRHPATIATRLAASQLFLIVARAHRRAQGDGTQSRRHRSTPLQDRAERLSY